MLNNVFFAVLTATLIVLVQQGDGRQCCIGGKIINGACLPPCSKVCPHVKLSCQPFLHGTNDPDSWTAAQNIPCFQYEEDQVTGKSFLRTSCRCPDRDYTDDSNLPTLSNCILSTIEATETICMGRMFQVQLGLMYAEDHDIDFEEDVSNSRICKLEAEEDLEFQECIEFKFNTIHTMLVGDDLQFEDDTTVGPENRFTTVTIDDELQFEGTTRVFGNHWGNMEIHECEINTALSDLFIKNNRCDSAVIDDPSACVAPIAGGFKCIPEP